METTATINPGKRKRITSFGSVEVYEMNLILGDHPEGLLALGWIVQSRKYFESVDDYYKQEHEQDQEEISTIGSHMRIERHVCHLTPLECKQRLLKCGVAVEDIDHATQKSQQIRRNRKESALDEWMKEGEAFVAELSTRTSSPKEPPPFIVDRFGSNNGVPPMQLRMPARTAVRT
jgi:uncharacterized protein YciI